MSQQVENQQHSLQDPFAPVAEEDQQLEATLGVPFKARRTSKVDEVLAEAKDIALLGVQGIAPKNSIGLLHHVRAEEERLTTHLFECTLPGYRGWFWFATLTRAPRAKKATICEVGLLPGDDALLAPAWVPWAERLRPEDIEAEDLQGEVAEVAAANIDPDADESEEAEPAALSDEEIAREIEEAEAADAQKKAARRKGRYKGRKYSRKAKAE